VTGVRRILSGDDLQDTQWIVLEGYIDGCPQVTTRRSISTSALVSGALSLEAEKAQLIADVNDNYARYLAMQAALLSL
jgi:hypothetical protein